MSSFYGLRSWSFFFTCQVYYKTLPLSDLCSVTFCIYGNEVTLLVKIYKATDLVLTSGAHRSILSTYSTKHPDPCHCEAIKMMSLT